MLTRRAILLTGTASILVAGTGLSARLLKDAPEVREPWRQAAEGGFGDARLNMLAYAILAPNPHNRQPWWIRLEGDDAFTLFCDLDRRLPETDPFDRQITLGLGAFIELFKFAAAEQGYQYAVATFPEGEPAARLDEHPIARILIRPGKDVEKQPLFEHALERRTARVAFDPGRPVSAETLNSLAVEAGLRDQGLFNWTNEPRTVELLKSLCREGWQIETHTPETHKESTSLTRIGASEVRQNPDGISLYGPMMEALSLAGMLSRNQMAEPDSQAFRSTVAFYNELIDTSQAFGWLSSPGNSRLDQLEAGAAWLRLHLSATQHGLAFHPLSQVLQEFPSMADCYTRFHDAVGVSAPSRVQGLFRFGYAPGSRPAPRWPLVSRISGLST